MNDKRLQFALEFAGENRPELEKVLSHYKDDSEKLMDARFLIENMSPKESGFFSESITVKCNTDKAIKLRIRGRAQ